MRHTPLEQKVIDIAAPVIEDLGFSLVTVNIVGEGGSRNVQIMAENPETGRLGIDDCTKISKAIAVLMDVEDPISGAYRLEVSSPGIDRVLIREQDFARYVGFEIKLETNIPTETGQKKFRGFIESFEEDVISLNTDQGVAEIPFDSVAKAKLVLSDSLIKKTADKKAAT